MGETCDKWHGAFQATTIRDARDLSRIPDASVHLVVTSPPYWTLKQYAEHNRDQMGDIGDYEAFLAELDKVWRECKRVLVGGGRICCVVGVDRHSRRIKGIQARRGDGTFGEIIPGENSHRRSGLQGRAWAGGHH